MLPELGLQSAVESVSNQNQISQVSNESIIQSYFLLGLWRTNKDHKVKIGAIGRNS